MSLCHEWLHRYICFHKGPLFLGRAEIACKRETLCIFVLLFEVSLTTPYGYDERQKQSDGLENTHLHWQSRTIPSPSTLGTLHKFLVSHAVRSGIKMNWHSPLRTHPSPNRTKITSSPISEALSGVLFFLFYFYFFQVPQVSCCAGTTPRR